MMHKIVAWSVAALMTGLTGHFMGRLDAEITFSDGVLNTLHIYSTIKDCNGR